MALDRLPVAALDGAGQPEVVLDDAPHEGVERLRRRCRGLEEGAGDPTQRDEVVRRGRRACVVQRAMLVCELEWAQAEQLGELDTEGAGLVRLAGDCGPGAVELLGAAIEREG